MADDKVSIGSVDILSLSDGIGERQATVRCFESAVSPAIVTR